MAAPSSSLTETPWYKKRASGWAHFSVLPNRKLLTLYLAVFFLFSMLGFYSDLTNAGGNAPPWAVLVIAILSGAYAALYPYVLVRKPIFYLYVLTVLNFFFGSATATWLHYISAAHPAHFHHPGSGINFAAQGINIVVICSYIFFIIFIRAQAVSAFRVQNELNLAHGIQRTLVPPIALSANGYDLHGLSLPSEKVGGDLVDVVPLDDGSVVAYVSDVSGHGLQAGILMGQVKTAARTILLEDFATPEILLRTFCDRLNRALPGVKETHMYATLAVLHLGQDGTVHYALAGHPAILHYTAETGSTTELGCEQFPVGLLPVSAYFTKVARLESGDILIVTTDGILEACNATDEEFGEARLAAITTDFFRSGISLEAFSSAVTTAVQSFGKQADDQTLLIIRRQQRMSISPETFSRQQHTAVA